MTRPLHADTAPRRAALLAVTALAVNLTLLLAGRAAGASYLVPGRGAESDPVQVGPGAVALSTVLPLTFGLVVTAAARRRRPGAVPVLRAVAVLVTLTSLAMPLSADTDAGTKVLLAVMHLVVGAAYLAATRTAAAASVPAPVPAGSVR